MKVNALLFGLGLGLVNAAVASSPHHHRHVHKREAMPAVYTEVVTVPVNLFEYNGKLLTEAEVCAGIVDGTLEWAAGSVNPPSCNAVPASVAQSTSAVTTPLSSSTDDSFLERSSSEKHLKQTSAAVSAFSSVRVPASVTVSSSLSAPVVNPTASTHSVPPAQSTSNSFCETCEVEFPDGELDCSTFPADYGAIEIPWMNLDGWSGVQTAVIENDIITGLATTVTGMANCSASSDGSTTFCSYACPPGYQKSQWPSTQGAASMAVSVGGLMCGSDNKLHLTNAELSTNICIQGTGKTFVQNLLNTNAAICRTDYPGTEDETIPLNTQAGQMYPLTCPNSSTYYQHLGAQTSAQYYVNPSGVPVETACIWGQDGTNEGNWAPVVIGAETDSDGNTWLSIMTTRQNDPVNYQELDYSIELEGDFGGDNGCYYTVSGNVGYYCNSGTLSDFGPDMASCRSFDPNNDPVPGCTVQLMSGLATYHLVPHPN